MREVHKAREVDAHLWMKLCQVNFFWLWEVVAVLNSRIEEDTVYIGRYVHGTIIWYHYGVSKEMKLILKVVSTYLAANWGICSLLPMSKGAALALLSPCLLVNSSNLSFVQPLWPWHRPQSGDQPSLFQYQKWLRLEGHDGMGKPWLLCAMKNEQMKWVEAVVFKGTI